MMCTRPMYTPRRIISYDIIIMASCCLQCTLAFVPSPWAFRNLKQTPYSKPSVSKLHLIRGGGGGGGIELSDVLYDNTDMAFSAWEWTNGLGAPAALIAGAVLVTLLETREEYTPKASDTKKIRIGKLLYRFLLASSFGLEVVSIFVATVTGSALLGHGEVTSKVSTVGYRSCLALLHHHHELNYLTIQIGFLQGLLHWLASVALELSIPRDVEPESARRMNLFLASCLGSLCVWILAFYNHHLNFYSDYATMLRRFVVLFYRRYIWTKPFRPLSLVYIPSFMISLILGWRAFTTPPSHEEKKS